MISVARKCLAVFALLLALLAAAAVGYAQGQGTKPLPSLMVSGSDIGFRLEGRKGNSVTGRFMVRIEGKWLDVDYAFGPKVLTTTR
jgi:hypothetical protein